MDREPRIPSSESELLPRYSEGWREILSAPDAVDYQMWVNELVDLTQQQLRREAVEEDRPTIMTRWQHAIELVADCTIDPEDLRTMTEAEIVETALLTLQANLEGIGWDSEGLAFTVPNMFTGEEASIDLRQPFTPPPNN